MPDFFDQLVVVMTTDAALDRLRTSDGSVDPEAARVGAVLSAAAVVFELAPRTATGGRGTRLAKQKNVGAALDADTLFGSRLDEVATLIASEAHLSDEVARELLTAAVGTARARLNLASGGEDRAPDLSAESAELVEQGWGRWLDELRVEAPDERPNGESDEAAIQPSSDEVGDGRRDRAVRDEHRRRSRVPLVAGLLMLTIAALVALAGLAAVSWRADDGESTQSSGPDEAVAASSPATSRSVPTSTTVPRTASTATPTAPSTAASGLVSLQLALADPQGRTDSAGTVDLDLDTETGEVCYSIEVVGLNEPFPGHIHVGPSDGSGGIIVDFGIVPSPTEACVESHPTDVRSIVENPTGHYFELHDPIEGYSIRSQLGETETSGSPDRSSDDGSVVVEESVFFRFGSTQLDGEDAAAVADLASDLRAQPDWRVTLVGNTDGVGPIVVNLSLSLQRAIAVREALVAGGVSPDAVVIRGDGPFGPVGENESAAGRRQNRRVDIIVTSSGDE